MIFFRFFGFEEVICFGVSFKRFRLVYFMKVLYKYVFVVDNIRELVFLKLFLILEEIFIKLKCCFKL